MDAVKAVNPASWITLEALREQHEAVPEMAFRRFHSNQCPEREAHWLPPGAWQKCVGEPTFTDGEPIWMGVDVGGDKSASAVVWINQAETEHRDWKRHRPRPTRPREPSRPPEGWLPLSRSPGR